MFFFEDLEPVGDERNVKLYTLKGDAKNFVAMMWQQLQEGTSGTSDIHLQFQDDKEMCINSSVLCSVSEYFQIMLSCGLRENLENKITLPTVTHATFNRLLAFTLGQDVELQSREELMELVVAADMMRVSQLVEAGVGELKDHLTMDNCLDTLALFRKIQPDEVSYTADFIFCNLDLIEKTDKWSSLDEEELQALLKTWTEKDPFYFYPEVPDAVFRWLEASKADSVVATRILSLIPFENFSVSDIQNHVVAHPSVINNQVIRNVVEERLRPRLEMTLLVVGSVQRERDGCTDNYICCWSERQQEWSVFPPPPEDLPQDFAIIRRYDALILSGGLDEKKNASQKVWIVRRSSWQRGNCLKTGRYKHATAIVDDYLLFVGGLPGPLKSVEFVCRRSHESEVGSLQEAVYDCGVAAAGEELVVVGGSGTQGPVNTIQTFNTRTHTSAVISPCLPAGLDVNMGFTRFAGDVDGLLFVSGSGHLLKVVAEKNAVSLESTVPLKDFQHGNPFAVLVDGGGVVVCDSRAADCRYSLDGEKKEESRVIGRLRDDIKIHAVFRFFLPLLEADTQNDVVFDDLLLCHLMRGRYDPF